MRKEDARFVLPNAAATRIIVTMNFRSLRHFFTVRCDKAAQWEIRDLALEMLRQVYALAPAVFGDLLPAPTILQSQDVKGWSVRVPRDLSLATAPLGFVV